jgi:hypothetical protein
VAGRSCPLHYRYAPSVFARCAHWQCETLYVVGGLYGNEPALQTVLAMFAQEPGQKRLLFNGDFHWFDTDPARFARITESVLAHDAIRGNVETEIGVLTSEITDNHENAGCGCAYPDWVGDEVVLRSNRILQRLHATAQLRPDLQQRLAALPMWLRVDVGDLRLGVVHGDAESLAGWGFAQEHLVDPGHQLRVQAWFDAAQVQAFACSHTCLPVFQSFDTLDTSNDGNARRRWVFNNGAAGMPNFRGQTTGLLTRIATTPFAGPGRGHGVEQGGVHIDAITIAYDAPRWRQQFLQQWPAGSDAHASYWHRIQAGPDFDPPSALRAVQAGPAVPAPSDPLALGPQGDLARLRHQASSSFG